MRSRYSVGSRTTPVGTLRGESVYSRMLGEKGASHTTIDVHLDVMEEYNVPPDDVEKGTTSNT